MARFTDGKLRKATKSEVNAPWCGCKHRDGRSFRCYVCGVPIFENDLWRWVYNQPGKNFLTCVRCDGPDVVERFNKLDEKRKFETWYDLENVPDIKKYLKLDENIVEQILNPKVEIKPK